MPQILPYLFTLLTCLQITSATQVIANWDVVPGQRIDAPFKAGVVAFHESGVDLEFRINGGSIIEVEEPTFNDRTRVYEYWIEINPADYADGAVTLSATAQPEGSGHTSRVLGNLILYANANGSLTPGAPIWVDGGGSDTTGDGSEGAPYATIKKAIQSVNDGGIVYLKAGLNYKLSSMGGGAFTYWTTVSAAPGLGPDEVQVAGSLSDNSTNGRYNYAGIKWQNVSLFRDGGDSSILYTEPNQRFWLDRVAVFDKGGRWDGGRIYNNNSLPPYITNSYLHDLTNTFGTFHRNNRLERIGSDTFRSADNLTVINVRIKTMDRGTTSAHPDFFQLYLPNETTENIIFYNVESIDMGAQGIFGGDGIAKDLAFVNVLLEKDPPDSNLLSQNAGSWHHVLLWHVTIVDQTYIFRGSANDILDFNIQNSVLHRLVIEDTGASELPDVNSIITRNHIRELSHNQSQAMGTLVTLGDPLFVDESSDDYRLQASSPATGTGTALPGVPADLHGVLYNSGNRNRGALSANNPGNIAESPSVDAQISTIQPDYNSESAFSLVTANFLTRPNARFQINSSPDFLDWQPYPHQFSDANGSIGLTETIIGEATRRFYRVAEDDFPWRKSSDTDEPPADGSTRSVDQDIHTDDRVMLASGTTRWVGDSNSRVGNGYSGAEASVYILPVELPELQAGEFISSATLSINISGWNNHGDNLTNIDLYGITFVDSNSAMDDRGFYVDGANPSGNSSALLLHDNFASLPDIGDDAETETTIPITSEDFSAHVQSLYDGGAQAGDYMFLTLAHDLALTIQRYYIFSTADSNPEPQVNFLIGSSE
jgi:hypothetical protein|tara:strand:- start:16634 stop:19108 length:2475 start_codon:yes stop_codon:yes gene_type:complete